MFYLSGELKGHTKQNSENMEIASISVDKIL